MELLLDPWLCDVIEYVVWELPWLWIDESEVVELWTAFISGCFCVAGGGFFGFGWKNALDASAQRWSDGCWETITQDLNDICQDFTDIKTNTTGFKKEFSHHLERIDKIINTLH